MKAVKIRIENSRKLSCLLNLRITTEDDRAMTSRSVPAQKQRGSLLLFAAAQRHFIENIAMTGGKS
jgi:hypothetical protein